MMDAVSPPSLLAATAALFLAAVFARTALHKFCDLSRFHGDLDAYGLTPTSLTSVIALGLCATEVMTVLMLILLPLRMAGACLAAVLLSLYGSAMAINILRGNTNIDCGCGGPSQTLHWGLVYRNMVLALIAFPAMLSVSATGLFASLAAVGGALIVFLVFAAYEQLLANDGEMRARRQINIFTGEVM